MGDGGMQKHNQCCPFLNSTLYQGRPSFLLLQVQPISDSGIHSSPSLRGKQKKHVSPKITHISDTPRSRPATLGPLKREGGQGGGGGVHLSNHCQTSAHGCQRLCHPGQVPAGKHLLHGRTQLGQTGCVLRTRSTHMVSDSIRIQIY